MAKKSAKKIFSRASRILMRVVVVGAVAGIFLSPFAAPQQARADYNDCIMNYNTQSTCSAAPASEGCVWHTDGNGSSACVPEMADMLVPAFLLIAGGIAFQMRRRAYAYA